MWNFRDSTREGWSVLDQMWTHLGEYLQDSCIRTQLNVLANRKNHQEWWPWGHNSAKMRTKEHKIKSYLKAQTLDFNLGSEENLWTTFDPSSWNTLGGLEFSRERRVFGHGFGRKWERKSEEFCQNFQEMHPIYTKAMNFVVNKHGGTKVLGKNTPHGLIFELLSRSMLVWVCVFEACLACV